MVSLEPDVPALGQLFSRESWYYSRVPQTPGGEDDDGNKIELASLSRTVDDPAQTPRPFNPGEMDELAIVAEGEEPTTWFVWILVMCSTIAGLLFGYDTGVISGALVTIGSDLGPSVLSDSEKELITSATTLGGLLGALVAGIASDYLGRRLVLGIADIIFIAGAIIQASARTVWSMIGGRFQIGVGVGLSACVVPLYIQELTPTRLRARMVVLNVVMITLGQVVAYGFGAGFYHVRSGWRYMVGIGAVPAAAQLAFLFFLPESPRILLHRGDRAAAHAVISKIYAFATPEEVSLEVEVMHAAVQQSIEITKQTTLTHRMWSMFVVPINRRALIVGCGMQAFQQLCGFNTLMYYSATLFKSIGFNQPTAVGLIISGTNFIFTLVALKWMNQIGRRNIMLWSAPGMVVGLSLASIAFHFLTRDTGNVLVDGARYSTAWSTSVLLSMILFVASYATGLGNVPWQQGELFGLEVRGIGTSLCTATNWAGNLLIGSTYLSLMAKITPAGAFGFYAGLCALGYIFVQLCFPETTGLSLEEVKMVFENGFGVRESRRLYQLRRRSIIERNSTAKELVIPQDEPLQDTEREIC